MSSIKKAAPSRRKLFAMVPAAAAASVISPAAAAGEPDALLMRRFRQWCHLERASIGAYHAHDANRRDHALEAESERTGDRAMAAYERLMIAQSETARGVIAKLSLGIDGYAGEYQGEPCFEMLVAALRDLERLADWRAPLRPSWDGEQVVPPPATGI